MTIRPTLTNQLRHRHCRRHNIISTAGTPFLRRHTSAAQPQPADPIIQHFLETPQPQWDFTKLPPSTPPQTLIEITRHLDSPAKSLNFLEFFRANSQTCDPLLVSEIFGEVILRTSREPGSDDRVVELYRLSRERDVGIGVRVVEVLIRCFGRVGMVDEAVKVFNGVEGCRESRSVCKDMVGVLLGAGRVEEAVKVFDNMAEEGKLGVGWLFFRWLDKGGRGLKNEEIVGWVMEFGKRGVFPDAIWLTRLCKRRMAGVVWEVLKGMVKLGGKVETASCNAVLTGFARERDFKMMNKVMGKMKEWGVRPNVITFGILVNKLCNFGRVDEALEVFEKMGSGEGSDGVCVEPDVIIYNTLITGLCRVGRQEEGLGLMERMRLKKGCEPNVVTFNCLIDGFCKAGEIERAHKLFERMIDDGIKPNVITLNTMVDGMCKHGKINSAVDFFSSMQNKGLRGDAFTYTSIINAFCNVNNIDKGVEYFDKMFESGCPPDAVVYYTLICGLSQAGRMDDAEIVVSKLKEAGFSLDCVCYNYMINGFCKKKRYHKACEMLEEMEDAGLKPDNVTYNTLISYFSETGNFSMACKVMEKMIDDGLKPTVVTYGALIHAYCLNGDIGEGMKLFRDMSSQLKVPPNTIIYNMLIDSLCKVNNVELALSLMDDMKVKGVKPDTTTFNAMFKGLHENKLLEKAFELMDRMTENNCKPDYITMEILTEWLSAVGKTGKLKKFIQGYIVSISRSSNEIVSKENLLQHKIVKASGADQIHETQRARSPL